MDDIDDGPSSEDGAREPIGWNAIDNALASIYGPDEPPFHYGTILSAALGGEDYLQGISVYRCQEPAPHWHYVSYGFTELYEKETDDPGVNGYGFELTFRLARNEAEPPPWPINMMQNLGRYVFRSGNVFRAGHYLDCKGKIALGEETELCALLFTQDPALPPVESPHGAFEFLQIVGITKDEYAMCRRWNTKGFMRAVAARMPFYVTDLRRQSLLLDAAFRQEIEARAQREGSNCGSLFVGEAHFAITGKNACVFLGANAVQELKQLFVPRLGFARPLTVASAQGRVRFVPGSAVRWRQESETELEVVVPAKLAQVLSDSLPAKVGTYSFTEFPCIEFEVRRSEIKDGDGNIIEVIG